MKTLLTLLLAGLFALCGNAQNKKQQDREAILAMAGCYKVTFDFAETFSPDTAYTYHDRYHSWGIEYVLVVEDNENLIQLQHLLIINDSTIIKHWRQDWVYEETDLLTYDRDNVWVRTEAKPADVKGTWTQKVYQVDDSPRYEARGTWVHVDGKHFWEGTADAPLPRREFTKRSDYNVMRRHSRMELTDNGWFLEQDNEKILRTDAGDQLICNEKGMERFTTGDFDCAPAVEWWEKNYPYWADVRTAWEEVFAENPRLKLEKRVNDQMLWQQLFALGDEARETGKGSYTGKAKEIIKTYLGS